MLYQPFPSNWPEYTPRDKLADWLECYVSIQDLATDVAHFATHRVLADRDATVEWATVGLGAGRGKQRMEARMLGAGSSVKLTGAYFLDGTQQITDEKEMKESRANTVTTAPPRAHVSPDKTNKPLLLQCPVRPAPTGMAYKHGPLAHLEARPE